LADAIGQPEGAMLRARGDGRLALIRGYLRDEESQIVVNKFANNAFYRRTSPTSFYTLQTSAANGSQVGLDRTVALHYSYYPSIYARFINIFGTISLKRQRHSSTRAIGGCLPSKWRTLPTRRWATGAGMCGAQ
jgi:hypothetical protein